MLCRLRRRAREEDSAFSISVEGMLGGEAAAEDRGLNGKMLDRFNDQACWRIVALSNMIQDASRDLVI